MDSLHDTAPEFVEMAHSIVWAVVATTDTQGRPRSRVLHPIWEWDGTSLTGWIATSPASPKAGHLAAHPEVSITYWSPTHDTCTANCFAVWEDSPEARRAGWDRFLHGPAPVGYDPSIVPSWTSPDAEAFGVLRVEPYQLRLMPGSLMLRGEGTRRSWRA
jgi:hypothetical protein